METGSCYAARGRASPGEALVRRSCARKAVATRWRDVPTDTSCSVPAPSRRAGLRKSSSAGAGLAATDGTTEGDAAFGARCSDTQAHRARGRRPPPTRARVLRPSASRQPVDIQGHAHREQISPMFIDLSDASGMALATAPAVQHQPFPVWPLAHPYRYRRKTANQHPARQHQLVKRARRCSIRGIPTIAKGLPILPRGQRTGPSKTSSSSSSGGPLAAARAVMNDPEPWAATRA